MGALAAFSGTSHRAGRRPNRCFRASWARFIPSIRRGICDVLRGFGRFPAPGERPGILVWQPFPFGNVRQPPACLAQIGRFIIGLPTGLAEGQICAFVRLGPALYLSGAKNRRRGGPPTSHPQVRSAPGANVGNSPLPDPLTFRPVPPTPAELCTMCRAQPGQGVAPGGVPSGLGPPSPPSLPPTRVLEYAERCKPPSNTPNGRLTERRPRGTHLVESRVLMVLRNFYMVKWARALVGGNLADGRIGAFGRLWTPPTGLQRGHVVCFRTPGPPWKIP